MSETDRGLSSDRCGAAAISSEIGRGHPSYLDSVLEALRDMGVRVPFSTVFRRSRSLSLLAWRSLAVLYSLGGRGGLVTRCYNSLRSGESATSADSLPIRLLGRDLRKEFENFEGICLVAHPLVANILSAVCHTWYVHGEIAAPAECAVSGAERIFVPLSETGDRLVASGADRGAIVVTGLIIEPCLLGDQERAFLNRLERIESGGPLTVGFFTSGAYPAEHMAKIMAGARSVVEKGHRAVIFTGTSARVFEWTASRVSGLGLRVVEDKEGGVHRGGDWQIRLVSRRTRQDETSRAGEMVASLDAFVAASHERTNWGVGLGLPMFILFPLIGTYSAQNFDFARRQGVVCPLTTLEAAKNLGSILAELRRSGKLSDMARRGFGSLETDGARSVATHIVREIGYERR